MNSPFRRGFLYGLASMGLTPTEFGTLVLEKHADLGLGSLANVGAGLAFGMPLAIGGLAGAGAAHLMRPDYGADIKAMKRKELIDAYRMATRKLTPKTQGLREPSQDAGIVLPTPRALPGPTSPFPG